MGLALICSIAGYDFGWPELQVWHWMRMRSSWLQTQEPSSLKTLTEVCGFEPQN